MQIVIRMTDFDTLVVNNYNYNLFSSNSLSFIGVAKGLVGA